MGSDHAVLTIVGIDPGLAVTGFGVVRSERGALRSPEHGAFRPPRTASHSVRLLAIHRFVHELLLRCRPDAVAVEEPFMGANSRSALTLGRAQAAAMLAAAVLDIPVFTYPPAQVKNAVAGYGRGDKRQVAEMVRMQLGLDATPEPDDAADALAVALCHAAIAQRPLAGLAP